MRENKNQNSDLENKITPMLFKATGIFGVVSSVFFYFVKQSLPTSIAIFLGSLSLILLAKKHNNKNSKTLFRVGTGIIFSFFLGLILLEGGLQSHTSVWLTVLPFLCYIAEYKKDFNFWSATVAVIYLALFAIDKSGITLPVLIQHQDASSSILFSLTFLNAYIIYFAQKTNNYKATLKEAAEDNLKRFQLIANSIPGLICYINENNEIEYYNLPFEKFFSFSKVSDDPIPFSSIFSRKELISIYSGLVNNENRSQLDMTVNVASPANFEHTFHSYLLPYFKGDDFKGFFCLMIDITQEIAHKKQVEEAKTRYDLIIKGAGYGIWDWFDINKDEVYWSPELYNLMGFTQDELKPSAKTFYELMHPDDVVNSEKEMGSQLAKGNTFLNKFRMRTKSGSYRWFKSSGYALKGGAGAPLRMTGSIIDITDAVHSEIREQELTTMLKSKNKELEKANDAKSIFLSSMNHELRTPLNGILGFVDILESSQLNSEQRRMIETIRQCGNELNSILSHILELSRMNDSDFTIKHEEFYLKDCYSSIVDDYQALFNEKGIQFNAYFDESINTLHTGDPYKIKSLISNLLSNAYKFTDRGMVELAVSKTNIDQMSDEIEIKVSDTGRGIGQNYMPKLFQYFTQEDQTSTRKHDGAGLGLAYCKSIIEIMGGEINVQSEKNKGTTFTISFPLHISTQSDVA